MKQFSLTQAKNLRPVMMVLGLVILGDIWLRLSLDDLDNQRSWQPEARSAESLKRLTSQRAAAIITALEQYDAAQVESSSQTAGADSSVPENQAGQEGDVDQLYIGSLRFRLLGVFSRGERFAVLQQRDAAQNDKSELRKVEIGDIIDDYMVVGIDIDRVQMDTEDGRQVVLMLFSKSQSNEINNTKK